MDARRLVGLAVFAGLVFATATAQAAAPVHHTAKQILTQIEADPVSGPLMRRMASAFPAETLASAQTIADEERRGVSAAELDRFAKSAGSKLMQDQGHYLATAPDDKLVAVAVALRRSMEIMKSRDIVRCAELSGGPRSGADPDSDLPMFAALIDAMKAGHDFPVHRSTPTPEDQRLVAQAAAASRLQLSTATRAALAPGAPEPRTPEAQCELGMAGMQLFTQIPPDVAGRVLAVALIQTGGQPEH
jgi:hypothetical protein